MSAEHVPEPGLSETLAGHREAIFRYLRSLTRDHAEAEDLTQDTLLRAHRKLSSLKDPASLLPWLYRIATNVFRDRFRQASYRHRPQSLDRETENAPQRTEAEAVADDSPRLDQAMEQREMGSCVQRYIQKLPDSWRAAILLHDCEGQTNPEIADMLDVSLATVKIRLHRARKRLRAALNEACSFSVDERGVLVCEPKSNEPKQ